MLYRCKDPEKPKFLLLGSTGISAVNIGGTTIHSGLASKPGLKVLGLNDKSKAVLTNIKLLSLILSLGEIFMMIHEKAFAGLSIMTIADFNYLQSEENLYFLHLLIGIVGSIS